MDALRDEQLDQEAGGDLQKIKELLELTTNEDLRLKGVVNARQVGKSNTHVFILCVSG